MSDNSILIPNDQEWQQQQKIIELEAMIEELTIVQMEQERKIQILQHQQRQQREENDELLNDLHISFEDIEELTDQLDVQIKKNVDLHVQNKKLEESFVATEAALEKCIVAEINTFEEPSTKEEAAAKRHRHRHSYCCMETKDFYESNNYENSPPRRRHRRAESSMGLIDQIKSLPLIHPFTGRESSSEDNKHEKSTELLIDFPELETDERASFGRSLPF